VKGKELREEQQGKLLKTKVQACRRGVQGGEPEIEVDSSKMKVEDGAKAEESPHVPAEACGKDAENKGSGDLVRSLFQG
jgi:hypothetical protein